MGRAFTLFVLIVAGSCQLASCSRATEGDKVALAELNRSWGDKYEFHLSSDIYWSAKLRPDAPIDEAELRKIFDQFTGTREKTVFVYMNVYDPSGKFLFQLFRGEDGLVVKETKAEHY